MTLECTHRCFVHIDYEQRPVVPAESYSRRMMPLPHSTGLKMSKLWDTDRGSKRGHCFGTLVYKYMRPSKKKIQKVTHALGSNFKKKKVQIIKKNDSAGLKKMMQQTPKVAFACFSSKLMNSWTCMRPHLVLIAKRQR